MRTIRSLVRLSMFSVVLFALAGCGMPFIGTNEGAKTDGQFSGDRALTHVRYLSEAIGSRPASSRNEAKAVAYVAEQFRSAKLDVARPSFKYETYKEIAVELDVIRPAAGSITATSLVFSGAGEVTAELIDVGEGKSEDFSGRAVSGKVALIRRGVISFTEKVNNAANAGALAAVIYNNVEGELRGRLQEPSRIPAIAVSSQDGLALLDLLRNETVEVKLMVDAQSGTHESRNVVGVRRSGSSKIVIVGGHYDSVDAGPGANDNASGVGTVIELARSTSSGRAYPFELRFIAFGAEELGLIGSQRYVDSLSSEERERIEAVINLDMVGVGDDLRLGGSPDLIREAKDVANGLGIEARDIERRFANASDHTSFIEAGIPALMLSWQDDPRYHTKDDRAEYVSSERLAETGQIVIGMLDRIAEEKGTGNGRTKVDGRAATMVPALPEGVSAHYYPVSHLRR